MQDIWSFHSAGKLVFGLGALKRLGELVREAGWRRVLVVTDATLVKVGAAAAVVGELEKEGTAVEVYDGGQPEPAFALAAEVLAQGKRFGPDAVLGLGGGSNMDLAKIAALLLKHGGNAADYAGENRVPGPVLPIACVPTTSGTGSEVTASCVLTDTERHLKVGVLSNYLRPALALVDPELTFSCPKKVTADSGIDALTHAIEAYTAVDNRQFPLPENERSCYQGRNPIVTALAERAIRLAGEHLANAVEKPSDPVAREGMALAAVIAGIAFSNSGVALVHAMEYPVGGAVHVSHGAGNGLLLPYVMRFNLPERVREFGEIARMLGAKTDGLSPQGAAEAGIEAVVALRQRIGIPERLREIGCRVEQLAGFAEKAHGIRRILRVNPRQPTVAEIEAIYQAAY